MGGLLYYRLRMIDLDGSSSYSSIESIRTEEQKLSLFPNPFSDELTIQLPGPAGQPENWQVQIFDQLGKVKMAMSVSPAGQDLKIDMRALPPGIYFIKVSGRDEIKLATTLLKRS